MDFAQKLTAARKAANLSQDKLAAELHITRQAVSKWESGHSTPDLETFAALCQTLNVTPEQLLFDYNRTQTKPQPLAKKENHLTFILSTIFLMLVFVSGMTLFIINLYFGGYYDGGIHRFALRLMYSSVGAYAVLALVRFLIQRHQAKPEKASL